MRLAGHVARMAGRERGAQGSGRETRGKEANGENQTQMGG